MVFDDYEILRDRPSRGQFTAVWTYALQPWSCVYRWDDDELWAYDSHDDVWEPADDDDFPFGEDSVIFLVYHG